MSKKIISIFLTLCLLLSLLTVTAFAATTQASNETGLTTAVANAAAGDTIQLMGSITLTAKVTISKNLTLDLNGYTITGAATDYAFEVSSGTLNITDTSAGTGTIRSSSSTYAPSTIYLSGGNLNISGGTVENTSKGQAIYNEGGGTVSISGGTVQNTGSSYSPYSLPLIENCSTGNITITGGTVQSGLVCAIYNHSTGKITISGASTLVNSQASYGGGRATIRLLGGTTSDTVLDIQGGTVSNTETSSSAGFAVDNHFNGNISISGGTVQSTSLCSILNSGIGKITISGTSTLVTSADTSIYVGKGTISLESGTTSDTVLDIQSGTVSNTAASGDKYAVYNGASGKVIINSGAVLTGSLYPVTATPTATTTTVDKTAAPQVSVAFALTNATQYANGITWLVYDASTGGSLVTGVTGSNVGNTLTLTHASNLPAADYYVAAYDRDSGLGESGRLKLTVGAYLTKESQPNATFTATGPDTGTLSGVANGMKYQIGSGVWTDITDSTNIDLTGLSACTISVVRKGNLTTTTDSDAQSIAVTKADAPTTVGKTDCTTLANNNGKLTGVTTAMEYKLSTASGWSNGTGSEITGLVNGTYNVRVKATGTVLASDNQSLTIAAFVGTQAVKPNATFTATGTDTGTLSGVANGMKYQIGSGLWTDITDSTNIDLTGLSACTISVLQKGNLTTTTDSDAQSIAVTKASLPSTVGKTDCVTVANNDGKLTGVTTAMEYKLSTASGWSSGTGSDITGLANGTYYVRVKAAGTVLASDAQNLTIAAFVGTKESQPAATFTATGPNTGTLSGVASGMKYRIDSGSFINITSSADISLTGLSACTISVVRKGNLTTTTDSDAQSIAVTKADAPTTVGKTDCTTLANNNGKLTGVTTAMEYKLSTASGWSNGTGSDITGLANGTYYVRVKATGTVLASDNQSLTIDAFVGTKETQPNATFTATGTDTGTLTNVTAGMKYSVDGGTGWTAINGTSMNITGVTTANGVKVYQPGNLTTTTDSDAQSIAVTKALTPTAAGKTDCTTLANNDGKLTGVTTAMEYKLSTASIWSNGTGSEITGLANGTYNVRVKATGTVLASDNQSLTITAYSAPPSGSSYTPPAPVTEIKNGDSTTGSNLGQLVSGGKTLTVECDKGAKLVFATEALKGIGGQTSSDIKVEMKDVSSTHQESLPGKQVFSLMVSSGSSTITNFSGAVTVTLPYTLKDGESADEVTVWYLANDGTMTEIPCTYDSTTKLATFKVTHFSLYVVGVDTPWVSPFTDVRDSDWFYGSAEFVSRNGMMQGIEGSVFSPNTTVTRGMLVTILWRLEKEPTAAKTISFTDVSDGKWYAKAVAWAAANNIVTGYAGKYNPDDALTREQLAAILYRYAAYKNYDVNAGDSLSAFTDKPSNWALSSVNWAVAKGLIKGNGGILDPTGSATRAQAATILQRFIENMQSK